MHLLAGNTLIDNQEGGSGAVLMSLMNSGLKDHFRTTTGGYYVRKPKK